MLLGIVEGNATSTVKHSSLVSWKLLIIQALDVAGGPDGDPVLAIDMLGAGRGDKVLISNDGKGARQMVGDTNSPVRWTVVGICDEE